MEQTECSETSAYKIQTPGNHPKESIQHLRHGESLKSRNSLSSSWNPLLSSLTYPVLGPLNPVYTLVIISPCTCEDYPNLKMEAAGSCVPNYEASHPKRPSSISCKCTYRRAPVIRSERIISCHLSLRKKTRNYQGVSRFVTLKPR